MTKNFVDAGHVLAQLPGKQIVLERRPKRFKFGCLNYGEVASNWYNKADGDKWDVFAPGYSAVLPTGVYDVEAILGVLYLENGNHKIAVQLDPRTVLVKSRYKSKRARDEIMRYCSQYTWQMRLSGVWCPDSSSNS